MVSFWVVLFFLSFIGDYLKVYSISISTAPNDGIFLLHTQNQVLNEGNVSHADIYIHNGCFAYNEHLIMANIGEKSFPLPLYQIPQNLHCAVNLKLVDNKVSIDRPFADVIVHRDRSQANWLKEPLCITVQLQTENLKSITGSCTLSQNDSLLNTCLIRLELPYPWFHINCDMDCYNTNYVKLAYSVNTYCSVPNIPFTKQKIVLLNNVTQFQTFPLSIEPKRQFFLLTRPNLTFVSDSLESFFVHFRNVDANITSVSPSYPKRIELKVWIDSRLELHSATPLAPNSWNLKVSSTAPPSFHLLFSLQYQQNFKKANEVRQDEEYMMALVFRVKHQSESGVLTEITKNKQISLHWSVQYFFENSSSTNESRLVTKFAMGLDKVYNIAAVAHSYDIINTAAISGMQTAVSMQVFSITQGGKLQEVTNESHCISSEPRLLKTSPTCTSVFVDGSEVRGSNNIEIHVQFHTLNTKIVFTVWYPKLPITIWVSDSVLNAISDWNVAVWKDLPYRKRRTQEARQFACRPRYQRTDIRVLAAFHVVDEETGERTFLTGRKDHMFDVTQISANRIHSDDPSVLIVQKKGPKLVGVPKKPGVTRLVIKTTASAIDYGSVNIMVSDDKVAPTQLRIWPVVDVNLQLSSHASNPFQYKLTTNIFSKFTQQFQHGAVEAFIFYSDAQRELLSDIDVKDYSLSVFSSSDQTLRLTQQRVVPTIELIALNNAENVIITLEIHNPNFCEEDESPPVFSGQTTVQLSLNDNSFNDQAHNRANLIESENSETLDIYESYDIQPILVILLTLILIVCMFHLVTGYYHSIYRGYEKMLVPLLTRFSSNTSVNNDKDDDNCEWVWMPKEQFECNSNGSRYSQRSTLEMYDKSLSRTSSSDGDHTHKSVSVSYRGSEVSVFIFPQPAIAVHNDGIVSTALNLEDSPIPEPKYHSRFYSSLRPEHQNRRISENFVYMRPQTNYYADSSYQSIDRDTRLYVHGSSLQSSIVGNGVSKTKRSRASSTEYYGMRESIA